MRSLVRDYRYLLQDLIPHNRLLPERRNRIRKALIAGDESSLRREALLSLEELSAKSYLRREIASSGEEEIRVVYSTRSGSHRYVITLPVDEWNSLVGEKERRDIGVPQEKASAGVIDLSSIEAFPELIRSLSINDRNGTILQKLDSLLPRLARWLELDRIKLYLISEKIGEAAEDYRFVETIPEERFRESSDLTRAIDADGDLSWLNGIGEGEGAALALAAVKVMGEVWGVLEASPSGGAARGKFGMLTAAGVVGQAIENNVRLDELISVDKLTRIYNRHFYDLQLPVEIERATRTGTKLAMLLIDIDDFKRINDELGHKKGDEALVSVARLIRENLRKIDLPFRYGGEEFVILLPSTAHMEAIHTAERLRNVIASYGGFEDENGRTRRITVSIGIAVFPDNAVNGEELFVQADRALLRAKKLGKNRVELQRNDR